jgi:hypothetical protein
MKRVSILKYSLSGVPVVKKTLIYRALYGYTDHSNKGTYSYKRKGVLNQIEYKKLGNSVLFLNTKDVKTLIPLFKKYKIRINIMDLIIP